MRLNSKWNRRSFLGSVAAIAGAILSGSMLAPRKLFWLELALLRVRQPAVNGFGQTGNPYEELGVTNGDQL